MKAERKAADAPIPLNPLGIKAQPALPRVPWRQPPLRTQLRARSPASSSAGRAVWWACRARSSRKTRPWRRCPAGFRKATRVFLWRRCPPCCCCVDSFLLQRFSRRRTPVAGSEQNQQQQQRSLMIIFTGDLLKIRFPLPHLVCVLKRWLAGSLRGIASGMIMNAKCGPAVV